jgi:hypothetical protein
MKPKQRPDIGWGFCILQIARSRRLNTHLESAVALPESVVDVQLRKDIYQQLSRTCHYLGEFQEEQKYLNLTHVP